jgi:hypothetical protein
MLVIRNKQLDVLSTAQRTSFDQRMLVHLKKFHRVQYDGLGEEGVVEAVHYGITRAATYGITSERDVCKYLDLMFALGRDFDTDTQFDWPQPILTDPKTPDPTARINLLYDAALARIREAAAAAGQL